MEKQFKRIRELRKALELDLGSSELDLVDEIMEIFFEIIKKQSREISKLEESIDN